MAGSSSPIKMAIMAITTSSSISVKAWRTFLRRRRMAHLGRVGMWLGEYQWKSNNGAPQSKHFPASLVVIEQAQKDADDGGALQVVAAPRQEDFAPASRDR